MKKNIAKIIDDIIDREGGDEYVNHPNDRGGPTKYGITLETMERWFSSECTAEDVKRLEKTTAEQIYYSDYYIQPGINTLPELLQPFVMDSAVHHGPYRATKLLQETLYRNGADPGPLDGIIGPKTIAACDSELDKIGKNLINDLVNTRVGFVDRIVKRDSSQLTFRPGWVKRIESFRQETIT